MRERIRADSRGGNPLPLAPSRKGRGDSEGASERGKVIRPYAFVARSGTIAPPGCSQAPLTSARAAARSFG